MSKLVIQQTFSHSYQAITKKTILRSYCILYRAGMQQMTRKDINYLTLLKKSFRFVLQVYQEFPPGSKVPRCFQFIEIALIIAKKFKLGAQSIVCALLHRVIKDNKISELTLRQEFGDEVADIIRGFTKLFGITYKDLYKDLMNKPSNLQVFLTHFSPNNLLIILIRFARYLHKMYTIEQFTWQEQLKLADKAYNIYIPLANNLGLTSVYLELGDLCLQVKHRIIYNLIIKKIKATQTIKAGFLERFVTPIYTAIQREGIRCVIKGRTKSVASIHNKIRNRGIAFEDINDFYAIRVVFESDLEREVSHCWYVYQVISELYNGKIHSVRDWISRPKRENGGYEALHLTVQSHEGPLVEVQIRTQRMDDKAEYGEAAHSRYKSSNLEKALYKINKDWLDKARDYLVQINRENQHNAIYIDASRIYVDG